MPGLFERNATTVRSALAEFIGCEPSAFEGESLSVVPRVTTVWPYVAFVATCGTGTVLSVAPSLYEFACALGPDRHYHAFSPANLGRIVEEARRQGLQASASSPGIAWTLARQPAVPDVPAGFELRPVTAEWMVAEMGNRRFENGVGRPGMEGREFRNRYGVALFGPDGEPAAIAGAFFTYADPVREIGVDVLRPYRGRGLGALVVAAIATEILDRGEVPMYGCATTNIRSQRTALATGFLPTFSDAAIA